ncbi:MAG: hypothetical protein AAF570_09180, partial [Bacteroidota bacterium]
YHDLKTTTMKTKMTLTLIGRMCFLFLFATGCGGGEPKSELEKGAEELSKKLELSRKKFAEKNEDSKALILRKVSLEEEKLMTLILGADHKVHYFIGTKDVTVKTTDQSPEGLRAIIQQHLTRYPDPCPDENPSPDCWDPIIVIKPGPNATYGDVVYISDEMAILKAKKYALNDLTKEDSLLLVANGLE